MHTYQLESFLAAAETQSLSGAAKRESLTVQALTQRINTLETELGFPLFARSAKGVVLTPKGEVFAQSARQALEALSSGMERANALCFEKPQTIKLGHWWRLAPAWHRTIRAFCLEHPDIAVKFELLNSTSPFDDLTNLRCDLTPLPFGIPAPANIASVRVCES